MSALCGKCDVLDWFNDRSDDYIANSKFYIYTPDGRSHRLDIHTRKDLALYAPYLVAMAAGNGEGCTVHISSTCFIDREEAEHLTFELDRAKQLYRRCKRKKQLFDRSEAYREISWNGEYETAQSDEPAKQIVDRVAEQGEKATIDGIHDRLHDYYRREFLDYLLEMGYDKATAAIHVYGWERANTMLRKE